MDIPDYIAHPNLLIVFGFVLIDQIGIPVPALPILVLAGAAAATTGTNPADVAVVAVAATLLADAIWFYAGRALGSRVLGLMCRLSLSPDTCVRKTEGVFQRYGLGIVVVAKFLPGVAALGTVMAGVLRTSALKFLLIDVAGALLWVGVWLGLGLLFSKAIQELLAALEQYGFGGLAGLVVALAIWVLYRAVRRHTFLRSLRMARIGVADLWARINSTEPPLILDVRSQHEHVSEGRIPGAQLWVGSAYPATAVDARAHREVVVYCACPDEASAARVALRLKAAGFSVVRPLLGGIEAWRAAGYPIELGG